MRYLICLFLIGLAVTSCQRREIKAITSRSQPYIKLKTGTVIHAHEISWSYDGFNKELSANGDTYEKREVASFSNGYNTYANVHGNKFAPMVTQGNIDIFKKEKKHILHPNSKSHFGNYGGPYITKFSTFGHYYMRNNQHGEGRALQKMNYKNVEVIMPANALAYTYLRQYKRLRNRTNISSAIGIGLMIGGGILLNSHAIKTGNPDNIAYGVMAGGLAVTGISLSIALPRPYKLFRIVDLFNTVHR